MTGRLPIYDRDGLYGYTLVDAEDVAWALLHRWTLSTSGYVWRNFRPSARHNGKKLLLHREIMGLYPGSTGEVDHINRKPLDNRRCNLRLATRKLNAQNQPSSRGASSGFRGVSWDKGRRKWMAAAKLDGKFHFLGRFDDEREAAKAAAAFRREHMPGAVEDVAA